LLLLLYLPTRLTAGLDANFTFRGASLGFPPYSFLLAFLPFSFFDSFGIGAAITLRFSATNPSENVIGRRAPSLLPQLMSRWITPHPDSLSNA
jgi:hypothetical protein